MRNSFDGEELQTGFAAAFGRSVETITPAQMAWLIKFARRKSRYSGVELSALAYYERNFPGLEFRRVDSLIGFKASIALRITSKADASDTVTLDGAELL